MTEEITTCLCRTDCTWDCGMLTPLREWSIHVCIYEVSRAEGLAMLALLYRTVQALCCVGGSCISRIGSYTG